MGLRHRVWSTTSDVPEMHVGIAGPIDLLRLQLHLDASQSLQTSGVSSPLVSDVATELLRRGHTVSVFALSPDSRDWGTFCGDRLTVHVGPYRQRHRARDAFRAERLALLGMIQQSECDVVHAWFSYEFALAALRSGKPTLVSFHDWGPEILKYDRSPYRIVRLGMQMLVLRKALFLTANSPYMAKKMSRYLRRTVPVVPNGLGLSATIPTSERHPYLVIGAMNNGFGRLKNVQVLLKAFSVVGSEYPDAVLRLAGHDHGVGEAAHQWAKAHRLDRNVEFVGHLPPPKMPEFMSSLDLFVHPSLEESFGMVLIEALANGTAVLGGLRSGAVPWVLGYGVAGSLVDVKDPRAIAREISRLGKDEKLREALAMEGFQYIKNNFSIEHIVTGYVHEYERTLGIRRSA